MKAFAALITRDARSGCIDFCVTGLAAKSIEGAMGEDLSFYQGKLSAARYFYHYELSEVPSKLKVVMAMHGDPLEMDTASF